MANTHPAGGGPKAGPRTRLDRALDGAAIAAAASLAAGLALLALNQPWVSDDFSGAVFLREHPGLWDTLAAGYKTWTGRFTSSIFSWGVLHVRPVYGVLLWFALLGLVVMTFALARGRMPRPRRGDLYVLGLVLLAYWYGMPALEETVFWTAGSIVYLWPALLTLLFLYAYRRWDGDRDARGPGRARAALAVAGMFTLGVWVGGSQEQVLVACVLFLLFVAARAARAHALRSIPAHLHAGAIGLVLAGVTSLAAPGNGARLAQVPSTDAAGTAIASAKYLAHIGVEWLPPLVPWLVCIALLAVPLSRRDGTAAATFGRSWWVWLLVGCASISPLLVQPYFGAERTIMFLAVFLSVAVVALAGDAEYERVVDRLPVSLASGLLALLLLVAAVDAGLSGLQAGALKAGQRERMQLVEEQKREGMTEVSVPALGTEPPRRGVIWGDGTGDPSYWVNGVMADWYGVQSLVVTDPQGLGYGSEQ